MQVARAEEVDSAYRTFSGLSLLYLDLEEGPYPDDPALIALLDEVAASLDAHGDRWSALLG